MSFVVEKIGTMSEFQIGDSAFMVGFDSKKHFENIVPLLKVNNYLAFGFLKNFSLEFGNILIYFIALFSYFIRQ